VQVYTVHESYEYAEDGSRLVGIFTSREDALTTARRTVERFPFHGEVRRAHAGLDWDERDVTGYWAGTEKDRAELRYDVREVPVWDRPQLAPLGEASAWIERMNQPPLRIESAGVIKGGEVQWFDVPEITEFDEAGLGLSDDVFSEFKVESSE
jgi:hypothetical protein